MKRQGFASRRRRETLRQMKVLLLVHFKLIPPPSPQSSTKVNKASWRTEYDVREALVRLGHEVTVVGIDDDLSPFVKQVETQRPDVVFNLLEEFDGEAVMDQNIVSYLELLNLPYTGCNSKGLAIARDKATAKKVVAYHQCATPRFFVVSRVSKKIAVPDGMNFPMIVKYLTEEASLGLDHESVVKSAAELKNQVAKMLAGFDDDLLVEEFVEGREVYVGIIGNKDLEVLPVRELHFGKLPAKSPKIASTKIKWSASYRKRYGIHTRVIPAAQIEFNQRICESAQQIYCALRLSGYARIDFRVAEDDRIYFIEANPNPQICQNEDFADAAKAAGFSFDQLIQKILDLGQDAHGTPFVLGI